MDTMFSHTTYIFLTVFMPAVLSFNMNSKTLFVPDTFMCLVQTPCVHPAILLLLRLFCHVLCVYEVGKLVVFYWVPVHMVLPGNKAAIVTGKEAALCGDPSSDLAVGRDVYSYLCALCLPVKKSGPIHKGTHCGL
jgi:hypothetical protein